MSRYNAKESTVLEPTIGDGNCAFNAFALALARPSVLGDPNFTDLPDDHFFVTAASTALELNTPHSWAQLKKYLAADVSRDFRKNLQKKLSPILREMAIENFNFPEQKSVHLVHSLNYLKGEYDRYQEQRTRLQVDDADVNTSPIGDTYISHTFIRQKFAELFQANLNEATLNQAISSWWETAGQDTFLKNLAEPARSATDHDRWAGPTELAPLGVIFGVNLEITAQTASNPYTMNIHAANGKLSTVMSKEVAAALDHRNIIDDQTDRNWNVSSEAELMTRLDAVPGFDGILADVKKLQYHKPIPDAWSQDCVDELLARKLIGMNSANRLQLIVRPDQLIERAAEYADKNLVVKAFTTGPDRFRNAPTVYLQNRDASHWSNLAIASDLGSSLAVDPLTPPASVNPTAKQSEVVTPESKSSVTPPVSEKSVASEAKVAPTELAAESAAQRPRAASTTVPPSETKKPDVSKREVTTPEPKSTTQAQVSRRSSAAFTSAPPPINTKPDASKLEVIISESVTPPRSTRSGTPPTTPRSPTITEPQSERSDCSSTSKANYVPSQPEAEVNAGVNRAFDLLNASRSFLTDEQVAKNFEKAFEQFSTILHDYNERKIDMGFFKQEKDRIITAVKDSVQEAKKPKK